jgi:dTDP-4-amino-4,6-dideoxygalactose transaminase
VATFNVITMHYALPVFVDTDLNTFQIDPTRIAAAITPNTKVLLPVHIGGGVADMDAIEAIARRRNIPVVADACQAHLSEWRGRPSARRASADVSAFRRRRTCRPEKAALS